MVERFWYASFLLWVVTIGCFLAMLLFKRKSKPSSSLTVLTVGTFIAVVLLYLPVHCTTREVWLQGALQSVFDTIKLFSMGANFDELAAVAGKNLPDHVNNATLYIAGLFLFAPLITVTNVASFFSHIMDNIQFFLSGRRTLYIFSELNPRGLLLAESIQKHGDKRQLIVFANCAEKDPALHKKARKMGAVCLNQDIAKLCLWYKLCKIEIFLISDQDSKNLEHVARLNDKHKNSCTLKKWLGKKITIFVYSVNPAVQTVVDSLKKGKNLLDPTFLKSIQGNRIGKKLVADGANAQGCFAIRCVDPIRESAINLLKTEGVAELYQHGPVVSIAVVGMGNFGSQFLKNAVWLYQLYGYQVRINVFDRDVNAAKRLQQECPGLLINQDCFCEDDSQYKIHFHAGVDCFTSDFDRILLRDPRLENTQMVFVALGDDRANIEASMLIRTRFNQRNGLRAEGQPVWPKIYAVVRDEELEKNMIAGQLINHRGDPADIKFVGTYAEQYAYGVCENILKLDHQAFRYHVQWSLISDKNVESKQGEDLATVQVKDVVKFEQDVINYASYTYYRQSSTTRVIHEEMLEKIKQKDPSLVKEEATTEHMRWCAYMRSIGYQYSLERNDSAKLHSNLVKQDNLSENEKEKDKSLEEV